MPFMIAKDRNVIVPAGYFKSEEEFKKVLQYVRLYNNSANENFLQYCYDLNKDKDILIYANGGNCGALEYYNDEAIIKVYQPVHINRLIPFTRDLGEL